MFVGALQALPCALAPTRVSAPCAPAGASPAFPRGPGNLSSVITGHKHDNPGPAASRGLQSGALWTCYKSTCNLPVPTIKNGS